ncbi:hypothetical protein ACEWY4_012752 [Coilia grayii]|uniref:Specifically androgen-regulated gene protein n=1 Tax=Coilia grayii TaxID=363190 RepID=A0ABD1JUC2_9TELE
MPKSDTWPGAIVSDTMKEMDSAGSCDSVVSINSSFSDDSLEHLSAEERACLMFLEETIEALETEEDSGLSNDEPDHLPALGNLAARMANLSASMNASICHTAEPTDIKLSKDPKQVMTYLVPTPLVLANGSSSVLSKAKNGVVTKGARSPKPALAAVDSQALTDPPSVPSEVNVVVIPPPVKPTSSLVNTRDHAAPLEQEPKPEQELERTPLRGPLSYEGLVQLRKSASVKKAQEASSTPESEDKQPSKPIKHLLLDDTSAHAPTDQSGVRKPVPPAVAPKPKRIPPNIPISPMGPQTDRSPMNPHKVRMEALYKLGLLKDKESSTVPCPSPPDQSNWAQPPGFPPPAPPVPSSGLEPAPSKAVPTPSGLEPAPSKAGPTPPAADSRPRHTHWTSGVIHHRSMSDLMALPQPLSVRPGGGKSVTLERSGLGLGSSFSSQSFCDRRDGKSHLLPRVTASGIPPSGKPRSMTLDSIKDCSDSAGRLDRSSSLQRRPQESEVKGHVQSQSVAHGVLQTPPRMAEDRREALRKLGLLKN